MCVSSVPDPLVYRVRQSKCGHDCYDEQHRFGAWISKEDLEFPVAAWEATAGTLHNLSGVDGLSIKRAEH